MKNSDGRTTRRKALQIGATVASATVVSAVVSTAVGSDRAAASPADYGATGRVRGISGHKVDLDLLAGLGGAAAMQVVGRASMPLVGFSSDTLPRIGDLVAVSKTTPGYDRAAAPLIHYVRGVPRAFGDGVFVIAGEPIADHPALRAAAKAGTSVTISVFDTHLPVAQVFGVRPAARR